MRTRTVARSLQAVVAEGVGVTVLALEGPAVQVHRGTGVVRDLHPLLVQQAGQAGVTASSSGVPRRRGSGIHPPQLGKTRVTCCGSGSGQAEARSSQRRSRSPVGWPRTNSAPVSAWQRITRSECRPPRISTGRSRKGEAGVPRRRRHRSRSASWSGPGVTDLRRSGPPDWYEEMHERQHKAHSSHRIRVEHGIAHLKNWHALARHLGRREHMDDTAQAIAPPSLRCPAANRARAR